MSQSLLSLTPFIPCDKALEASDLPDKAFILNTESAKLTGQISSITLTTLRTYMGVINSYYSNLIEGNSTRPYEIRAAQRGDYSSDPVKRDLQKESFAHIAVQQWLYELNPNLETIFTPEFIQEIHKKFYEQVPESLWVIKDDLGNEVDNVVPGEWRTRNVQVGLHVAPEPDSVEALIASFCETYHSSKFKGDRKLISIMAAHHRLSWIHPFTDGNGRVGRLLTDTALKAVGLESYGAWCLSRGLAKTSVQYKGLLAAADLPRLGDYDGRGALSEKGLVEFSDYMLSTAIDQVSYVSTLLDLSKLRLRINRYVEARNDFRVSGMTDSLKPIAALVLYNAFIHGELDRSFALELCGMPDRSARRLLGQLKSEGLLSEVNNKSPLRWEIPEHAEAWYFPDLAPLS